MRSSDGFRRPREPDLPEYWDRLEQRLRSQIVERPPRKIRFPSITRLIRTIAPPALHGTMAMLMVAVVIVTGRGASPVSEPSAQFSVESTAIGPIWVDVKEIADPLPRRSLISVDRRPPRFVILISDEPQPWGPLPEPNSPTTV